MFRELSLCALLCASTVAMAAESVDDVLTAKTDGVSEEQLDETAAKLVKDDNATTTTTTTEASVTPAKTTNPKSLSEEQIPVLKDERIAKATTGNNWFRLIGSAVFVLLMTGGLIIVVKKSSKRKNIGGKKARIEVLHQHFLGPKKSVVLIQVAGEAILIGVTDNNINMIKPVALIDDEFTGESQDFNGFLEDEFTVEQLTAQKSRVRTV